MRYNNVELTVRIKGRPITEYPHNGQTFIEGRAGSSFEIAVKNHNGFRVEAVVSVDGLSVLDGKDAGPLSSGYVLGPYEEIVIPGWKVNDATAAAFEFGGKGRGATYAEQSTGSARNVGVLGLLVYREEPQPVHFSTNYGLRGSPWNGSPGIMRGALSPTDAWTLHNLQTTSLNYHDSNALIGGSGSWLEQEQERGISYSAASSMAPGQNAVLGMASVNTMSAMSAKSAAPEEREVYTSGGIIGARGSASNSRSRSRRVQPEAVAAVNNLGTVFGSATEFATETVSFHRGDMLAMIVLMYDDARGLRARGIDLSRRARRAETQTPNAFPGLSTGCTPPKGWRG